jgi:ABC-2 type transport system ATP-binding protein
MIAALDLSKKYGPFLAIDSVDFAIPSGAVVGFLGPNGAGKTTIMRLVTGYLTPTEGRVEVDGLDVTTQRIEVRKRIGYLPEAAPLYVEMRVIEFLTYRAKLYGIERAQRMRKIDLALDRCSLTDVRRRPIHQLSKGYRQRVGLAAALLHEPPVLILDEPTVGLDPAQIREFRALIRELGQRHTILLSTHILPEVELTCNHIIMISRGRIRAQGSLEDVRARAAGVARFVLEVDSEKVEQALRELRGVSEVRSVPMEGRWRRLTVTATDRAADLREPIAGAVGRLNCVMRELRQEAPSLEHLFMSMVEESELAAGDRAQNLPVPAARHERKREGVRA